MVAKKTNGGASPAARKAPLAGLKELQGALEKGDGPRALKAAAKALELAAKHYHKLPAPGSVAAGAEPVGDRAMLAERLGRFQADNAKGPLANIDWGTLLPLLVSIIQTVLAKR